MPIEVEVPNFGVVEFDDGTSEEDISKAIGSMHGGEDISGVKLDPFQREQMKAYEDVPVKPPTIEGVKLSPFEKAEFESMSLGAGKPRTGMEPDPEALKAGVEDVQEKIARPLGRGLAAVGGAIGDVVKAYAFEAIGEPQLQMQQLGVSKETLEKAGFSGVGLSEGEVKPWEEGAEMLPTVPRIAAKTVSGFIETAPQLALAGVNPTLGAIAFGLTPEGFDPVTAGAMMVLPGVGKHTGAIAELAAEKLGVSSYIAKTAIDKIGGAASVAGLISADQARNIMRLPVEERRKAFEDASGGALAIFMLSMAHKGPNERAVFFDGPTAEQIKVSGKEIARDISLPEAAQKDINWIPRPTAPAGMEKAPANVIFPTGFESLDIKEAARQKEINRFNERLNQIKRPKAEVPVGEVAPGVELTTQETPGMRPIKELQTFDDFVADFRERGRPGMTIPEVQKMYPTFFEGGKNREGARRLKLEAFPEDKPKAEVKAEAKPEEKPPVADTLESRMAEKGDPINPENIQFTVSPELVDEVKGPIKGSGYVQADEVHPVLGNTFSSNPEALKKSGFNVPSSEDLMKLPAGRYTLKEANRLIEEAKLKESKAKEAPPVPVEEKPAAPVGEKPAEIPVEEKPAEVPTSTVPVKAPEPVPGNPPVDTPPAPPVVEKKAPGETDVAPPPEEAPKPPTPAPAPAQPPPVTPKAEPSGHFGKDKLDKALDFLKKKKEKGATPQAVEEKVVRPESEQEERFQAAAEEPSPGEKPVRFAGEDTSKQESLYDQPTLNAITDVAGSVIESGRIDYPSYYAAMVEAIGPEFRRYFRRAYNQVRDVDSLYKLSKLMTPREEVELFDDFGNKVGKGAKRRPGLVVVNEDLIPQVDQIVTPSSWTGPDGDSIDWTQSKAVNLAVAARTKGSQAMMIADGPGVGKTGVGAAIAHMMTFPVRIPIETEMAKRWGEATPEIRATWLLASWTVEAPQYKGVEFQMTAPTIRKSSQMELEQMKALDWEKLTDVQKAKIYRNNFTHNQIKSNNVNADSTERNKVLVVGVSKPHLETAFKPDFEKFGIPMDNIEFITYSDLSNPGKEGTPQRARFDKMIEQEWGAVVFDEAHALKNAGSGREHSSRKLKTPFRVFMTATPMDNVPNAIYFFSEITGQNRFQVMDALGLQRIVKVIGGEDREFVVQKPGISTADVKAKIVQMRDKAIKNGLMIRREFPWWGDVIGQSRERSLFIDMKERWEGADAAQKADWVMPGVWSAMPPESRAQLLLSSFVEGEMGKTGDLMATRALRKFSGEELSRMEGTTWDSLRPEQKAKIFNNFAPNKAFEDFTDLTESIYRNAGYTPEELASGITSKKGHIGPYYLDQLTSEELAEQQKIFNKYQDAIDASRGNITRYHLNGQRSQELKRWLEQIKAKRSLPLIIKELEAGRNVVVYANTVNDHYVKGLGDSVWRKAEDGKTPNPDWPKYQGGMGIISKELERLGIPYSQIFGPVKSVKTTGIREFYNNKNRVALVTTKSGGAGLNLDDVLGRHPRTLIIVDIDWPGDMFEQVMYRVSRRNTASESKAHILMIRNGMAEEKIIKNMNKKLAVLRGIQTGKDTDLMGFLADLNNPENTKTPVNPMSDPNFEEAPTDPMPKAEWIEKRGRTGKIRWMTYADQPLLDWWHRNGGDDQPPFGMRRVYQRWKHEIWSDTNPEDLYKKPEAPYETSEAGVGYSKPVRFSGSIYDDLVSNIDRLEARVKDGIASGDDKADLADMKTELNRRNELDDRTNNMLRDNAEYQNLEQMLQEMPTHPDAQLWELQKSQIASDTYEDVSGQIPEPQAATVGPNVIPPTVVPPSLSVDITSMEDIMRKLRAGLGIPIRYKAWLGGGFFDPKLNYFRVKRVNDHGAFLHEAGHALDHVFGFFKNPVVATELDHLGDWARPGSRSSWNPAKSQAYKLKEGVAEFVRYWMFEPAEATKMAPNMEKLWNSILDANKDLAYLREIREDIQNFKKSPMAAQLRSFVVRGDALKQKQSVASVMTSVVDDLHFVKLASDTAFRATNGNLKPSEDPYMLYRLLRGNYGRADAFLRYGSVDARTGDVVIGKSLNDALKGVNKRITDFDDWMVCVQGAEMIKRGKDPGIDPAIMADTLNRYKNDTEFHDAFSKVQEWNRNLLKYAHESGLIPFDVYQKIIKENPIYVPMRRLYEAGVSERQVSGGGKGGGGQLGQIGRPGSLKRRAGSLRPILSPLESMVENAYYLTFAAEKNRALMSLVDLADIQDMGKWINPWMLEPKEKVQFQAKRVKKQLEDEGVDVSMLADDVLLHFWRESRNPYLKDNVIKVTRGGQSEYYQLDPDLFKATMAMDKTSYDGVMKILATPSQLLRAGVTTDPTFAIRNIVRDTISASVISRFTDLPFEAAVRGTFALIAPKFYEKFGLQGKADALRTIFAEWKASGAEHAIETAYFDRDSINEFIKDQISQNKNWKQRGLFVVKHPLAALQLITQFGEQVTRVGEYQVVFDKMLKDGFSRKDAHVQAAYESRDLQDFAMGGSNPTLRSVKLLTAFWNAGVQGRYRFFRSLYDPRNPDVWKKTLLKGFGYITMAKLAEQAINWNNEEYWNKPRWQRMMFFHIPLPKPKDGSSQKFILVPVPFEAGFIFASIPGSIMEYIKKRDPATGAEFLKTFAGQMWDNPVPQTLMTVGELIPEMGYDYFQHRTLLPRGMENEPYWARATDTDSVTARSLGKLLDIPAVSPGGVSPKKLEHLIRRTTGGIGAQVVHRGLDPIIGLATGSPMSAPNPYLPLRSLITQDAGSRSQVVDDFYKKLSVLKMEKVAREKYHKFNRSISLADLDDMLGAEKAMAEKRKTVRGAADAAKRERVNLAVERIAKRYVRNPDGTYKGYDVNR